MLVRADGGVGNACADGLRVGGEAETAEKQAGELRVAERGALLAQLIDNGSEDAEEFHLQVGRSLRRERVEASRAAQMDGAQLVVPGALHKLVDAGAQLLLEVERAVLVLLTTVAIEMPDCRQHEQA